MPGAFEAKIHLPYQHRAFAPLFVVRATFIADRNVRAPVPDERDSNLFRGSPPTLPYELREENQAEANIVVAVVGAVPVTIRGTAVLRIVVPGPAAQHPVRTHDCCPF